MERPNNAPESIDDLLLGSVSESVGESDELFRDRLAQVQAKLAQVAKDEGQEKNFDKELARIIPSLEKEVLRFVIILINSNVPSLTILSMISLSSEEAGKVCYLEINKYIEERADFSALNVSTEVEEKIALWWTFIMAANHLSKTTKLKELRVNKSMLEFLSLNLSRFLEEFLQKIGVQDFDKSQLLKILEMYQKELFLEDAQEKE